MNSHEVFIHIHQGCFAGTGAIFRLPQCQWSKPDGYGKISQCITTTKHSKAKAVCIFHGICCTLWFYWCGEFSFFVLRSSEQVHRAKYYSLWFYWGFFQSHCHCFVHVLLSYFVWYVLIKLYFGNDKMKLFNHSNTCACIYRLGKILYALHIGHCLPMQASNRAMVSGIYLIKLRSYA